MKVGAPAFLISKTSKSPQPKRWLKDGSFNLDPSNIP
jgi:hypothetical protein